RRGRDVAGIERATFQQTYADGPQVIAGDHALFGVESAAFAILRQWSAERRDVPLVVRTRRWKLGDATRGANARLRLERVRDGLVEARSCRGVVAYVRQMQLERQHVGRLDAE